MNIYRCGYQGISGYACRTKRTRWLFVPDLGQPDRRIHRNLQLRDLEFMNEFEKRTEIRHEAGMQRKTIMRRIESLVFRRHRPATVYGSLFLPD